MCVSLTLGILLLVKNPCDFNTSYVDMISPFKWQLHKLFLLLIVVIWNYLHLIALLISINSKWWSQFQQRLHVWTLHCVKVFINLRGYDPDTVKNSVLPRLIMLGNYSVKNTVLKSSFDHAVRCQIDLVTDHFRKKDKGWILVLFWV